MRQSIADSALENKLKRYSFSYICKSIDPLVMDQKVSSNQHHKTSSLNSRSFVNAEAIKLLLKYNKSGSIVANGKLDNRLDSNLLNEYLMYNKYLSESNLLNAKSQMPFLYCTSSGRSSEKSDQMYSNASGRTKSAFKFVEDEGLKFKKREKDLADKNLLFEHMVNASNGPTSSSVGYDSFFENDDEDEEEEEDPDEDDLESNALFLKVNRTSKLF
jgi:hypothetical protein